MNIDELSRLLWQDDIEFGQWFGLFNPFNAVKRPRRWKD